MSDRDASLDEASNIAFKALKEKPPAKPVDLYYIFYNQFDFLYMNIYNIIKSNVLEMVQFASALYDYILIY